VCAEQLSNLFTGFILSDNTQDGYLHSPAAKIFDDVCGTAEGSRAANNVQDRDWRFRRDTLDVPPKVFVQHQIAYHNDPAAVE
jgi:hypothetical protein